MTDTTTTVFAKESDTVPPELKPSRGKTKPLLTSEERSAINRKAAKARWALKSLKSRKLPETNGEVEYLTRQSKPSRATKTPRGSKDARTKILELRDSLHQQYLSSLAVAERFKVKVGVLNEVLEEIS